MPSNKWFIRIGAVILFVLGFFIAWWPLMILAPLLAVLYGCPILAVTLAVCADLLFGTPVGRLHVLVFPCTIGILLCIGTRSLMIRHLR